MKIHSTVHHNKENDNSLETTLKVTEYCNLCDRELKITVMKKRSKIQENTERQFNELRNKINEQKEYFTEEI